MSGTDARGDAERTSAAGKVQLRTRAPSEPVLAKKQETFSKKTFGLINGAPAAARDIDDASTRATAQVRKALKVDASFKARPPPPPLQPGLKYHDSQRIVNFPKPI